MKSLLLLLLVCTFSCVNAASIVWNCFEQKNDYMHPGATIECLGYQMDSVPNDLMPSVVITSARNGSLVTLHGSCVSATLVYEGFWLQKSFGDVVDFSGMYGENNYFADQYFNQSGYTSSTPITTQINSTVYLAVVQDFTNPTTAEGKYYGWVELDINASGEVVLRRSALAIDGGSLVVGGWVEGGGAIPEPTSAVLVLVGAGLLGLRRKERVKP